MANKTDASALSIHGTNPQFIIEKILRAKIHGDLYWKEHCFALTAETLVDRAMELDHIGGTFGGNIKPVPFIQLVLKLLQIQPDKDIIVEFIKNEEFKYVRALGAFYMRLVGKTVDVYQYLEPLLNDYRKLRIVTGNEKASHTKRDLRHPERMAWAGYDVTYMDEFIDKLLREDMVLDIALPTLQKRMHLEEARTLQPRISALEDDLDEEEEEEEEEEKPAPPPARISDRNDRSERARERDNDRPSPARDRPSPARRRSRSPQARGDRDAPAGRRKEDSVSPARRPRPRSRSRSPLERRRRSASRDRQPRKRSRSPRRRSPSPELRRRAHSRSPPKRRSPSPRKRSPSPKRRERSRSRSRERRESRSPLARRSRTPPRRRERSGSPFKGDTFKDPSRSRSRDGSRSPAAKKKKKDKKDKKKEKDDAPGDKDGDISEANALRASLGLKPLANVDDWKKKKPH